MIKKLISFLNRFIPKKQLILFNSVPDLSDNAYALYRYIREHRPDIAARYRMVFSIGDGYVPDFRSEGVETVRKKSLRGYWLFLRAAYVISTHGYFKEVRSGNGQIQLNLWHGCGYKGMGGSHSGYRGDWCFATSKLYQKIFSEVFCVTPEKVLPFGLPRNDCLVKNDTNREWFGWDGYRRIILWMPTYRKANKAELGTDGDAEAFGPFSMRPEQWDNIEKILEENNDLLIVKPHMSSDVAVPADLRRVQFIDDAWISARNVRLYDVLYVSDVLLSDYSSVMVDYLLTGRPIAVTASDLKDYGRSRGFVFNPIEDYLPGPVLPGYDAFIGYLKNMDAVNESWTEKRKSMKKLFHEYTEGNSAGMITDYFWGKIE